MNNIRVAFKIGNVRLKVGAISDWRTTKVSRALIHQIKWRVRVPEEDRFTTISQLEVEDLLPFVTKSCLHDYNHVLKMRVSCHEQFLALSFER